MFGWLKLIHAVKKSLNKNLVIETLDTHGVSYPMPMSTRLLLPFAYYPLYSEQEKQDGKPLI
jgi:hypothetical protein